jgi:hypothetical protein
MDGDQRVGRHRADALRERFLDVLAPRGRPEHSRGSAQLGRFFDQMDRNALTGEFEGGAHPGKPCPDHQGRGDHGEPGLVKGRELGDLGHGHAHLVHGPSRGRLGVGGVDPRALVADVGHLQEVLVQPGGLQRFPEERLVRPGCAGGDNDPVQPVLVDEAAQAALGVLGAGEEGVVHMDHVRKGLGRLGNGAHVDHPGDVDPAGADEDADARRLPEHVPCRGHGFLAGE